VLLTILARLTGCASFAEHAEAWNHDYFPALDRAEIYLAFLVTKNASRDSLNFPRQRLSSDNLVAS